MKSTIVKRIAILAGIAIVFGQAEAR